MGLACSQIRLLTLTARKADCEYGIAIDSKEKMALTREQSNLSQEYYSKLKAAKITYFENGQYNKMNYGYLMGYGSNYTAILSGDKALKDKNSMILTDYKGAVVLSDNYANVLKKVLGDDCIDATGRGRNFDINKIPEILSKLTNISQEKFETVIANKMIESSYSAHGVNTLTGEATGEHTTVNNSETATATIQKLVDFYYPILQACAVNGWTTEYNQDMAGNEDYISDALVSGTFCLAEVNDEGTYDPNTSLTYFLTAGYVQERTDSDAREEITAWYKAEQARISEKEDYLDIEIRDLSTELEAINTEMESLKSLIDNAIQTVFDWGSS